MSKKKNKYKHFKKEKIMIKISDLSMSDKYYIAEQNGLDVVCTTSEASGFPRNICHAIVGFDSIEEARELASENGMEVVSLSKRDGHDLWYRDGYYIGFFGSNGEGANVTRYHDDDVTEWIVGIL